MKLRWKFALLSASVSAIPMAIAGYSSGRIGQDAIGRVIEDHEQTVARQVASNVTERLRALVNTLQIEASVLDLTRGGQQLPPIETISKFLQLVYHQSVDFTIVGMYDDQGRAMAPPAFQENPRENVKLGLHEAMTPDDADELPRRTPLQTVLEDGAAVGPVFLSKATGTPQLILAVKYDPVPDEEAKIIAAQVSLQRIGRYLAEVRAADRRLYLVDRESRIVASSEPNERPLRPKRLPRTLEGTLPARDLVESYLAGTEPVVGAYAAADPFYLGVVAERPVESAMEPLSRMRWATLFWMVFSGAVAVAVAVGLGRRLANRVGDLAAGARHVAQGRLDTQLAVNARDELGDLAKAFNAMTTSLDAARKEILRQTREIKAWNESLERRVEEKTRELREAQDMLLRSRSLAAIGGLGAGVAHEINNPLTAVLGLVQLLLEEMPEDHPARPSIKDVEAQALRIQQIVSNLLRFARRQSGEDFRTLDLSKVIEDALELCNPAGFTEAGISITKRVPSPSPPIRGSAVQLQAALIQIIKNARAAMEVTDGNGTPGGTLTLETSMPEDKVLQLRITDTGRGIRAENLTRIFDPFFTTKQRWDETGLGLSVVHKIVEDHAGQIRVESEPGAGTSFFITFPIDTGSVLLA
jgi:signal transduction histidine kinase